MGIGGALTLFIPAAEQARVLQHQRHSGAPHRQTTPEWLYHRAQRAALGRGDAAAVVVRRPVDRTIRCLTGGLAPPEQVFGRLQVLHIVVHQLGAIHISQQFGRGRRGLHQRVEIDAAHAGLAFDLIRHVLRRDERHAGLARQALRLGVHIGVGVGSQHETHAGAHGGVGLGGCAVRHCSGCGRQFAFVEFAHDGARKLLCTDLAMAARSAALRAS